MYNWNLIIIVFGLNFFFKNFMVNNFLDFISFYVKF